MLNLLLFSASSYQDSAYLSHTRVFIDSFLEENDVLNEQILFIPYASIRRTYDEYEEKVKQGLQRNNIKSLHKFNNAKEAILNAKVIMVGGGNSFELLNQLYKNDLLENIRESIKNGVCYIGWSAGSNIAGKSIKTTNDMPIVMPESFDSLNLFPHQINPHFISGKIQGHNGESREERLQEYLIINQNDKVYALPEGCALKIKNNTLEVIGYKDVKIFTYPMQESVLKLNKEYTY